MHSWDTEIHVDCMARRSAAKEAVFGYHTLFSPSLQIPAASILQSTGLILVSQALLTHPSPVIFFLYIYLLARVLGSCHTYSRIPAPV
jgi:hypothetical protein